MGFQLCQILVVLFALATVAWAIPVFNEPNKWDLNGNQCPLYPKRDVPCPLVCVTDLTECPSSLQPNCPPGESFCLDGSCATTCPAALPNPCLCGETAYLGAGQLLPCRTPPIIDIPSWDYLNKTALVQGACGQAIDQLGLLSYGATPTAPIWLDCPIPGNNASFNFHEPAWLALWAAMAAEAFLIAAWYMYKRAVEPRTTIPTGFDETVSLSDCDDKEKLPIAEETKSDPTACSTTSDDGPLLRFQGYRNHALGTLVIYSIVLVSIGWVVLISSITADYYGKLTGQPYSVSHENSVLSAQLFIAVWYFMTAWFLTLNITRARLRNFFRLRTDPDHSSVIQVEQPSAPLILLDHQSTILTKLHRLENQLKHMLGWHVHITTAPLQRSTHGRLFFVYQCTRYVFNPDHQEFEPFDLKMGETAAEILAQTQGLTEQEAELRTELLGTNFISVEVPSFYMAMVEEFTGFFYLYQLTILWLFYYLSYYKIGLVDTGVVIISALVKVVIRLQSEKRLKRMAEHEDTCMVLRDNKWVELSTAQLVPGDVYQVKPGQVVPCDAVVLSGNIVADESSLTGEPLPIRKFPLRNEGQMFQLGGSGKISALFAGTTISQAEPDQSNTEAASALVCRIGTATDKGQLVRKILFPNPVSFIFDEQLKLVMCILACEGLIMFGVGIWLQRQDMNMSWFNGMFCLAQIVSPILPAALVVGQSVASTRLRKMQIFCVDLPRIMVAGKTQIFCFDKTGTLTKEGLEFYGCQCVTSSPSDKPGAFEAHTMVHTQMPRLMQLALASCHAVTDLHQRLIGNPVDIEMFRSTGWDLRSPESPQYLDTIGIDQLILPK
ncbi:E1-E2 ATPase-domain-containing protein [Dimargaris cristalligena]|uniref:E1-E2 ATPase-domain-containing protein n=1 Tax=Dimargaris cristalligena TaxID=215637 RepID=A0A4P9ZVD7_9FUNG|nr:E1-E2 ATPase-domain-containing protein [Dimargaris cristalligena]|eukprot:RKP37586.1 E1-E2 ATPase-domain-containing protein [Dimargaris cristalligena]